MRERRKKEGGCGGTENNVIQKEGKEDGCYKEENHKRKGKDEKEESKYASTIKKKILVVKCYWQNSYMIQAF